MSPRALASSLTSRSHRIIHSQRGRVCSNRLLTAGTTSSSKEAVKETVKIETPKATEISSKSTKSWWGSPEWWGGAGAIVSWGMSLSAIYDAYYQGPEVISLTMTPALMVYSSLFARWAYIVKPRNYLLMGCHLTNIVAQGNQLRRALEYKSNAGQEGRKEVDRIVQKAGVAGLIGGGLILGGPKMKSAFSKANFGVISKIAASDAGPFTVHFWAPVSKLLISGASFLELHRPTDEISLSQYAALTVAGFFFSRYALLVTPIDYVLCSVNITLLGSSAWHLGRKIIGGLDSKKDEDDIVQQAVAVAGLVGGGLILGGSKIKSAMSTGTNPSSVKREKKKKEKRKRAERKRKKKKKKGWKLWH